MHFSLACNDGILAQKCRICKALLYGLCPFRTRSLVRRPGYHHEPANCLQTYSPISLMRLIASTEFSYVPNAVRRKKCSPLGPKPEPGVPTTLALASR